MNFYIALILVLLIIAGITAILYFLGKKIEKRNAKNQETIEATSQNFKILVIDKRKMRLRDANLPKIVVEQTPKYLRRSKVPVIKAKIGPKVATLMCDPKIYDTIPTKQEITATISGIYITAVKGKLLPKPVKKTMGQKIKGIFSKN